MLTDADHVWHAMYFKHPDERARYIKSQIPHADAEHLLRKYNKFPRIYRDDMVEFAVIVNGKAVRTVATRQEAHDFAKQQKGYVVVADVPKSERNNPVYDRYYQEIIKTQLVPSLGEQRVDPAPIEPVVVEELTPVVPIGKEEEKQSDEQQLDEEQQVVEEQQQVDEQQVEEEQQVVEEQQQLEEEQQVDKEQHVVEEQQQLEEEQQVVEEQQQLEEEQQVDKEQQVDEEQQVVEEQQQLEEEQQVVEEQRQLEEEQQVDEKEQQLEEEQQVFADEF